MLRASSLTREEFLGWVGNSFMPSPKRLDVYALRDLVKPDSICLIWNNEDLTDFGPNSKPVVGIDDAYARDFFAFTSTYIGSYQPFSAFFRVVKLSILVDLLFDRPKKFPFPAEKFIGAIIAETRSQLGRPRRDLSEITIQSCLATLSFSAATAIAGGVRAEHFSAIFQNWSKTRKILTEEPLAISSSKISGFWDIVKSAVDGAKHFEAPDQLQSLVSFLGGVIKSGDDGYRQAWHSITKGLPRSRLALNKMRDAREERVRAMDEISDEISSAHIDPMIAEAMLGYAACQVADGSLRYFGILDSLEERFPLCVMWFGLFCSLRSDSDALLIGECLGRRVKRHLDEPLNLFSDPTCDLSFEEFSVVTSAAKPPRWRTEFQNLISVEIFPGLSPVFRLGGRPSYREMGRSEPTISIEAIQEMRFLAERLYKVLDAVDVPNQGRLFQDERSSRDSKPPRRTGR
jgi:hypothetical protein